MSLTFHVEPVENVWDEMSADWIANWGEEYARNGGVFNLNKERYEQYEKDGYYLQFVARSNGVLAGYCGMYLYNSMHTQDLTATEDVMFLKQKYRAGRNASRFFAFVESNLKERGVKTILCLVRDGGVAGRLLQKMGYKISMIQLTKRLT